MKRYIKGFPFKIRLGFKLRIRGDKICNSPGIHIHQAYSNALIIQSGYHCKGKCKHVMGSIIRRMGSVGGDAGTPRVMVTGSAAATDSAAVLLSEACSPVSGALVEASEAFCEEEEELLQAARESLNPTARKSDNTFFIESLLFYLVNFN